MKKKQPFPSNLLSSLIIILSLFHVSGGALPAGGSLGIAFQGRQGAFKQRSTSLAAYQVQASPFQTAPCMVKLPLGVVEGTDVICGYLTVPQDHTDPGGPTIQLAVMIIKSHDPSPAPDPLVMAQGGPGGSTIDAYAQRLLTANHFVTDRDIILFDQRGTLYSKPVLYCKQIDQLTVDTLQQDISDAENQALTLQALQECRQQLVQQESVNLSDYDSLQNAQDIESLRQALGYEKINFYGVSYGTLLGLHYMNLYPDSLRSSILDGVILPQTNFILNSAQTMNQSFERLFEACREDPACNEHYPDLKSVFYNLVAELDKNPARILMTDSSTGQTYPASVVNGTTFLEGVFQMLYAGSIIPALPRMIYDAKDGNWDFFGRILSLLVFDHTMSVGMYYSVVCAEEVDFIPADQNLSGLPSEIVKAEGDQPEYLLQTCKLWDVKSLSPQVDQPITSSVPTLLLSGYFDPIAPDSYAAQAAKTLSHSYQFVFPNGGHGQALEGPCANSLIQAFLDQPGQKPDGTCVEKLGPPQFYTPANTLSFPVAIKILNLTPPVSAQLAALAIGLLCLLSAVPGVPLIWLIVWIRRRRSKSMSSVEEMSPGAELTPLPAPARPDPAKRSSFLSRTAGWFAFFSGPLLALFVVVLGGVLFQMALANDYRIFFGVGAAYKWLFSLPWIFGAVGLAMAFAALAAWIGRYWSGWTRVYYSLLAISALLCIYILAIWGVYAVLL